MEPIEFISQNIKNGQKVTIIVQYGEEDPRRITCFFKGYRVCAGSRVALSLRELVPVFCKVAKNGNMSHVEIDDAPQFQHLLQVVKEEHVPSTVSAPEMDAFINAMYFADSGAMRNIRDVMEELDALFPGAVIPFRPTETPAGVCESHGGIDVIYPGDIAYVRMKDQMVVFGVQLNDGDIQETDANNLHRQYDTMLLAGLYDAIINPPSREELCIPGVKPLLFDDMKAEDLPDVESETFIRQYPVLHRSQALWRLKQNLWMRTLSNEQLTEAMALILSTKEKETAVNLNKEDLNGFLKRIWDGLHVSVRKFVMAQWEENHTVKC